MRRVKLTDLDVLEIRRLYALGDISQASLAERYDVRGATISGIVNGKRRLDASTGREDVIQHAGLTWHRRGGHYWYKAPSGSGRAYEMRDACAGCGKPFFAARSAVVTRGLCCSIRCARLGERNPAWSRDLVGYRGAHKRVADARGKAAFCSVGDCDTGSKTYHWASLTGDYTDVWDYESMCVSHHRRYDFARARRVSQTADSTF